MMEAMPEIERWYPTDYGVDGVGDADNMESISAWSESVTGIEVPTVMDASSSSWEEAFRETPIDAILCVNVVHISPFAVCEGLFRGAGLLLSKPGSPIVLYGPFSVGGKHTAPSNEAFDTSLKARHPSWGVRALEDVDEVARKNGFYKSEQVPMPANNFTIIWRKGPQPAA